MADRGFFGGLLNDEILWFILVFLILFWGWGACGLGSVAPKE